MAQVAKLSAAKSALNQAAMAAIEAGLTELKTSEPIYESGPFEIRTYLGKKDGKVRPGIYFQGKAVSFLRTEQILLLGIKYPDDTASILADFLKARTELAK